MLTLNECRKLLGDKYKNVPDEEIIELIKILDTLAEVAIKTFYYDSEQTKICSPYVQGKQ